MKHIIFQKPAVTQLIKEFPTFKVPKDSCNVHNFPPLDPILSQMNPFYTFMIYFFTVYFNIILTFALQVPPWFLGIICEISLGKKNPAVSFFESPLTNCST
jgi:hypothetical protein